MPPDHAEVRLADAETTPDWSDPLADMMDWQAETFPKATPESAAEHLRREVEELAVAPRNAEEQADVLFLLMAVVYRTAQERGSADWRGDFRRAVAAKLAVNRKRTWKAPDAQGVVEHVRD